MEIVGLKQKVDNDINKLIAKFVGIQRRKFIKELTVLRRKYLFFLINEDFNEDEAIEYYYNHYNSNVMLFYTYTLRHEKMCNCARCYKFKRSKDSILYCKKCDRIEFQEYQERCIKNGWGDGCD
jgi:hypothetical protein